jgi:hypothetical protein
MQHVLGVCPHDVVKDPEKWMEFARELQKRGVLDFSFSPELCFEKFAAGFSSYTLAYAHPLHAVRLRREMKFIPLAAHANTFDEAVLIANKQVNGPTLSKMGNGSVACIHGSPSHAAYLIDLHDRALPAPAHWVAKTSYPDVVMAVAQGEAPYGVVLKSVWDTMMTLRDRVRPFHATTIRQLVHVFMLAPLQQARAEEIARILVTMHQDDRGLAVLNRIGCAQLVPVTEGDLGAIESALTNCGLRTAA